MTNEKFERLIKIEHIAWDPTRSGNPLERTVVSLTLQVENSHRLPECSDLSALVSQQVRSELIAKLKAELFSDVTEQIRAEALKLKDLCSRLHGTTGSAEIGERAEALREIAWELE